MIARALAMLAALASLLSCATEEVVVATGGDGGGHGDEHSCRENTDCPSDAFCAKDDCVNANGRCQKLPAICDDKSAPTCGCDGVTYWNDCLRQQRGARASTLGECITNVASCTDPEARTCPVSGASCARLLPPGAPCTMTATGDCWVLPPACPDAGPDQHWSSCQQFGACVDVCSAIRAGVPHRLHPGPTCP